MATEKQVVAFLNDPNAGSLVYKRDWSSSCQALMYQLCKHFGSAPVIYPTAAAARAASTIVGTNPALALPGDFHHFDLNAADHISLSFGGSRGLMGSSHCPDDAATNAGFMTVEAYCKASGAKYLGFSRTDGANDLPIEVPVMAANSRIVGKTNAKRRTSPTIPKPGEPDNLYADLLTFNTSVLVTGYRTDLDPTHFIVSETCPAPGSNKFFLVDDAEDGGNVLWSHASTFTDPSVNGITSLDPVIPPVVTPPAETAPATIADVTKIVGDSQKAILAAFGKPAPVTLVAGEADKIASAVDKLAHTEGH